MMEQLSREELEKARQIISMLKDLRKIIQIEHEVMAMLDNIESEIKNIKTLANKRLIDNINKFNRIKREYEILFNRKI